MAETSCLATSTVPASHSFKAFSLSSGDAPDSGQQNDNASLSYSRHNAADHCTPSMSEIARRMAAGSDSSMNATSYSLNRPNSDYIHMSIDDICNKARQLINKDTFQKSSYELGFKEKAMVSKYIPSSESYRGGYSNDVDNLLRKYSNPSFLINNYTSYGFSNPMENPFSTSLFKENDQTSYAEENTKSNKSSFNSGSNIQITSSASTRNNSKTPTQDKGRRFKDKKLKRSSSSSSSKNQPTFSPSKIKLVKAHHQQNSTSSGSRSMNDESPNNNVIRFTRCNLGEDNQRFSSSHRGGSSAMRNKSKNDTTNNSCQCHKPKVPCPVHDSAQASMSHGQFSGATNDCGCAPSVECSCGGETAPESSHAEQMTPRPAQEQEQYLLEEQQSNIEAKPSKLKKKVHPKKKAGTRHNMINEAKRVYKENELLKAEGMYLRNELECTRKGLIMECAKVLHSVLTFCDEKAQKKKRICQDSTKSNTSNCPCSRMV